VRSAGHTESGVDLDTIRRTATRYPEWNVFTRSYRPDWCTVTEIEPPSVDADVGAPPHARSLRRSLGRLGLDLERRRRQLQGDDVDLDAAIEARVEVAARSVPDEAVYVDRTRTRRELSVLVLLDTSGSAGEPSGAGGTVFDHQRAAAAALTQALHDLGDRVALYGFSSQGRRAVQLTPVKRFADRYDGRTRRRLAGLVPGAYTRLGAAIRHGSSVLEEQGGTARRLLVVVSDGFAYDHGYEGAYAEADARRALAEARRRGTACLCLSIGADTDVAALRRVFGSAAFASFPRSDQLAAVAGPMFGPAIRFAASQRRTWQRNERTRERLLVERRPA
jgi:nitric oxide reductase activation protein